MKIAILGATSQIAKDLILSFSKKNGTEFSLFARNTKLLEEWINSENLNGRCQVYEYSKFNINRTYDIIINSVGIGDPEKAQKRVRETLAKLQGGGKKTSVKNRREKRIIKNTNHCRFI